MLAEGRRRLVLAAETKRVRLVEAWAQQLPFEDGSFDGLTSAYLMRYLDDLPAGLRELARVLRPGATAALLDFGVPPGPLPRQAWNLYVDVGSAVARARDLAGLARGRPLPRRQHPRLRRALAAPAACSTRWREAGFEDPAARRVSLGGCIVVWGRRQ